jgi:peptide/nickel transport system substrate-binding protein
MFRPVPEVGARIAELNAGNADIVLNITPDLVGQVDRRRASVMTVHGNRRIYIGFTFYGHQAIKDRRVRQALNYGFDFQRIINSLLSGQGRRTGTVVNPPFQSPNAKPYPYDPDRARSLLTEAGYTDRNNDGFVDAPNGQRLKLRMVSPIGRFIYDVELSQAIAADWRKIGVDVEVQRLDWSVLSPTFGAGKVPGDMFFMGAGPVFHCMGDLSDWYTGSNWDPGRWADPTYNAMVDELSKTFDEQRAQALCHRAQDYMNREAPMVFLYFQVDYYGVSNRLDWKPRPDERVFPVAIKWK